MELRAPRWFIAIVVATALAGCGGGGSSSSTNVAPAAPAATVAPTTVASPVPAASSTAASTTTPSTPTTTSSLIQAGAVPQTAALAAISSGYAAQVSLPATTAGATAVSMQLTSSPGTLPALAAVRRVRDGTTQPSTPLTYVLVSLSSSVTFASTPSFTFSLPSTAAAGASYAIAFYDAGNTGSGWQKGILGPVQAVGSNVTFPSASKTFTLSGAGASGFAMYVVAGATPAPTSAATATAVPTTPPPATPAPTPAPTAAPTATPTPTPTPTPAPTIASAPAVGYLSGTGGRFTGRLTSVSTGVTLVGVSTTQVAGSPGSSVGAASIGVSVGPSVQAMRRVPSSSKESALGRFELLPEAPVADAVESRAMRSALRHASSAEVVQSVRRTRAYPTSVGATTSFFVSSGAIGTNASAYTSRNATLAAVSQYGYIFVDSTLSISSAGIQKLAADFDNAYVSDTTHFGTSAYGTAAAGFRTGPYAACDATGAAIGTSVPAFITPPDNKIVVFVVDSVGLGSGVGGYFGSENYTAQSAWNCQIGKGGVTASNVTKSNEAPMIYVGWNSKNVAGGNEAFETDEDLVRGTAHELQHLINFVNHVVIKNGSFEDRWINEGLSMLAQDFALPAMFPGAGLTNDALDAVGAHAVPYLNAPQNFSVTGFTGVTSTGQQFNCTGCYGAEYLFQRYLYDRFGGDSYLRRMTATSATSYANLLQATATTDSATLLSDFAVALAASDTGVTTDPRFTITGLKMRGSNFVMPPSIAALGISRISLSGPNTAGTLASGSVSPLLGSFFYLAGSSLSANQQVTVTDSQGNAGLRAAVIQR